MFDLSNGNLGGHAIVASQIPLGTGAAFACLYKQTGGICFTIFGDGAVNQGVFAEAMNMAALMKLPCLFIVENNGMAMGTSVKRSSAQADLVQRGRGFGMLCAEFNGNDVDAVIQHVAHAAERARTGLGPSYLVAHTYRFRGHSMSDPMLYRTKEELKRAQQHDPIALYESRLLEAGLVTPQEIKTIAREVTAVIEDAVRFAEQSPHADPQERFKDVDVS